MPTAGVAFQGTVTNSLPQKTVLMDSSATFVTDLVVAGMTIVNVTDGSQSVVTAVVSETMIMTTEPINGSGNYWNNGDIYRVYSNAVSVSASLTVSFSTSSQFQFASKVIDARRHSRMREYEIQRWGVCAQYRSMYTPLNRDKYSGTMNIEGNYAIKETYDERPRNEYLKEHPYGVNFEPIYGPPMDIKVMYINPQESTKQSPYGLITQGTAVLAAPLTCVFRRGDLLKIHDKVWEISEIPTFEFWRNREIIGYRLVVTEKQFQKVTW